MEEFDDAVIDGGLLVIGRRHPKLHHHGTKKGVAIVTSQNRRPSHKLRDNSGLSNVATSYRIITPGYYHVGRRINNLEAFTTDENIAFIATP